MKATLGQGCGARGSEQDNVTQRQHEVKVVEQGGPSRTTGMY